MADLVQTVKDMYAAFARGDVAGIMQHVADDVSWESEGPAELVFTGIRRGKHETLGFFVGIAQEHADPKLDMTQFIASGDSVASFGRYEATLKSGKRVDTPVGHLFQFRDGKVVRFVNCVNTAAFLQASTGAAGAAG